MLQPKIITIQEKKLAGKRMTMSLAQNKTQQLWKSFMRQRTKIRNSTGTELYSLQCYPESYFSAFNPDTEFEKWALAEVSDFDVVPEEMETFLLPGGLYAVFHYQGIPSAAAPTFRYIFKTWLPNSPYNLDNRPHFEILGEKYKNESRDSEEDIYIPIQQK
jgi:AraC family transcriptional regulator